MKSRITIELNFDEGNLPVIQILQQDSDDVRDKLISSFLQSLQHTSRWGKIIYMGNRSKFAPPMDIDSPIRCWHIIPLRPSELSDEIKLMETVNKCGDQIEKVLNIHNNSDGFRKFLDELNIEWKSNGHYTSILLGKMKLDSVDPFELGIRYEKYKAEHTD